MPESELERLSREGLLSLTLDEMKAIQSYFQRINRDPTDAELETIAQTWSEHCYHKTFKARFSYRERDGSETQKITENGHRVYENLLKETIVQTTRDLNPSWCLSVFEDNAGVIAFDETDAVCFKVETHNHPSALEPYGGAGTGVGGVIRDVLGCGLGAKPVLNTDVFCFGPLNAPVEALPRGALHPKRIAHGVISGVRDYGNRMGIPTSNGAIYFDEGYIGNPLVFCGTVGLMPKKAIRKTVEPGDLVVAVGGRTGRDGIHGATFSSAPLESGITSSVVQIGHAIMEKKFMDVLLPARDKNLYRSLTDCGAGGFSSAIGELGKSTGVRVDLEKAPLKYPGLEPWEIWLSESQERMILAVPPEHWMALKSMFDEEDVEAVAIGEFTNDKKLTVIYQGDVVVDLEMDFLHDGLPKMQLEATWDEEQHRIQFASGKKQPALPSVIERNDIAGTLTALLQHPIIASKESVVRQYDHEVQGGSIIKPFMGVQQDGPSDACVFRPKLSSWKGVVVANGMNPEMGKYDPYLMAQLAVDEAYRNLTAVGGRSSYVAILDNFCWGSSKDPLALGGLVRAAEGARRVASAYGLPFISGKDSFNNTWKSNDGTLKSIPPTLLISAIGVLEDVRECVTSGLKKAGNLLYVVGLTKDQLKGSLAARLWNLENSHLPEINFFNAKELYERLRSALAKGWVASCHDVSEGGVLVALSEMAFGNVFGAEVDITNVGMDPSAFLFSETPSRFVVEVRSEQKSLFEGAFESDSIMLLGSVTENPFLLIKSQNKAIVKQPVKKLKQLWKESLKQL